MPETNTKMTIYQKMKRHLAVNNSWSRLLLLGLASGICTGLIIIAFHGLADWLSQQWWPSGITTEKKPWRVFLIPALGAFTMGCIMSLLPEKTQETGIGHVQETVSKRGSIFSWRNTAVQFFGAVFAIASGQSVGREGPAVHIGAATSATVGRKLSLPSPQLRLMVGCGAAAAIGASFNTPIAGVIFAIEVILLEYSAVGLLPLMVAATSATTISRIAYGDAPAFATPVLAPIAWYDLPWLLIAGIILGVVSAAFIWLFRWAQKQRWNIILRFSIVGVSAGLIGLVIPETLGVGYDTVARALHDQIPLTVLIALIFTKTILSAVGVGFRIPGGIVATTLVIGAAAGGAIGGLINLFDHTTTSTGSWVMIGMGTVMSAVLNAPLSGLTAVMELTYTPHMLMPTMVAIVIAKIVCREILKQPGAFEPPKEELSRWNLWLRSIDVTQLMDPKVVSCKLDEAEDKRTSILNLNPNWVVLKLKNEPISALKIDHFYESKAIELANKNDKSDIVQCSPNQSVWQVWHLLQQAHVDIAVVQQQQANHSSSKITIGVITKKQIENKFKE